MKMEIADWFKYSILALGLAATWGALGSRVVALEKAVEPINQMHTDIEVVKAAVLDIRDDIRAVRRGNGNDRGQVR
jgi:hypothetical protein